MSTEKETLQRVQAGLYHLRRGLTPFVESRMKGQHGANWLHFASRAVGGSPKAGLDEYGLLKTMIDNWRDVFDDAFARQDKHRVRNFTSMALEARNATSHLSIPLQDDEALRYLDAIHCLLKAVKAPTIEINEAKALYDAQRRSGFASAESVVGAVPASPPAVPAAPTRPTLTLGTVPTAPIENGPTKALRPWIDVALPHPDVLANRFKEAEFAADLFAVDAGHAGEDYASPENFFRITFLTEGLRRILTSSLHRLSASGGDPVIGLQTAFGGGKTHTMLAVYHLAKARDLTLLEGVGDLVAKAGLTGWTPPKVAVFVGTSKGTDTSLILQGGPKVHTLWGYIAWRLAGQAGLDLIAEAEAARTNPASELLVALFKLSGPALILLDELVAYARQLPEDRFEAFLSFIQSLTEAAKMAPGVLIIGSLPESIAEAGGPKGEAALLRLEKVFGRVQSAWLPASGDETYEIIRRRLFQTLDAEGEKARDETVKAFADLYKNNAAEFPPEAKESRYRELLKLSYPIHPELFDRLSKDWASLEKFQRTRGVLRFMANVVGTLWQAQANDPLITPARVPIAHERVRASVLYPLDPNFNAVVDKEVDGDSALPARMESNPSRRISQLRAATRAARAVFLCSAPLVGRPNAGLTGPGLRLACAEPGDQLAIFGEALRELTERATYLYEESGRYWFSTQPTLNRLADDRAKALPDHEVDEAITRVLREDGATRAGFHRIFSAPDDPIAIDESNALALVILGPATPHAGKGVAHSLATEVVTDTLMRCRSAQRRYRNTLLFVAADEALLGTAREVMRKALAWGEIAGDKRLRDQLPPAQMKDADEKAKASRDGAAKAVRLAWSHILFPVKATTPGTAFDLDHLSIASKDRAAIPAAAWEKVKVDSIASEKLGGGNLWVALKPLWAADRPHLAVSEVADWFASFAYLPKLRDRVVLENAIRDAVGKLDPAFGYADAVDEGTGEYRGLTWAKTAPELMPPSAVLVREQAALDQLGRTAPHPVPGQPSGGVVGNGAVDPGTGTPTAPSGPSAPKRFWGSVEIDMVRPVKSFDAILNAVVMELQRTPGAKVTLTLEVEVEAEAGFSDTDVGVVRDNARQLKFKTESTGFGD
ncbi:ATPase [Methylobacterium sp. Leaf121]|nr:ATPase [Methylobacterium sp. Leaf121]